MTVDQIGSLPHTVRWLAAAPLWSSLLAAPQPTVDELDRLERPTLLRMTSDDFMDDLRTVLADDPAGVHELQARPVSYRAAPPGAAVDHAPPIDHVKLFQPIHGHFNLVAATLVCRTVGLPDKDVDAAADEIASFVMRRVAGATELAWTPDGWLALTQPERLAPGEQLVPMFPVPYTVGGRVRRLVVGLVPTASTESAVGRGPVSMAPGPDDVTGEPHDHRLEELDAKVLDPLRTMTNPSGGLSDAQRAARQALQIEASRFVVLDLGDVLFRHAPGLWSAVQLQQRPGRTDLASAYDLLRDSHADLSRGASWLDALRIVWGERDRIWGETAEVPSYDVDLGHSDLRPAELRTRIAAVLPALTAEQIAMASPPPEVPKLDPRPATRYVIRCAYRRPHCGPLHPDVVSEPSEPFAIASFFDRDAPARPIHIALPIDTSIAGLRTSPKNVRFMLSRELHQQVSRVSDLKKVIDGQLASEEEIDLGVICSFSIPIITICALVLLIVFIFLLNIVFFWVPFFRTCIRIPLKARN